MGGTVSRIVDTLLPGSGVVTTRADVHYVVTEYGIANLWGRSLRERARSLIDIAHPDHREALEKEAVEPHRRLEQVVELAGLGLPGPHAHRQHDQI